MCKLTLCRAGNTDNLVFCLFPAAVDEENAKFNFICNINGGYDGRCAGVRPPGGHQRQQPLMPNKSKVYMFHK